jgi:uncharacterized protein with PIN domain
MKTCICDKCGKEIEMNVQEEMLDHEKDGKDITEQFFVCPECGQHYTIFIEDNFMRQKIAARKRLKKMPKHYNPALDTALVKEMQKHFKKLKTRYGKG